MHSSVFILFVVVYFVLCGYVCWRGAQAIKSVRWLLVCWFVCVPVLSIAFFAGLLLRETNILGFSAAYWLRSLGVTWILTMPYWVTAVVFWDLLRLAQKRWRFFPAWVVGHYARAKLLALAATIVVVAGIFFAGYINFAHPITTRLDLKIAKPAGIAGATTTSTPHTLHIVVAADIHLGDIIGVERLRDYVARINALKPDLILLPGDIIDRSVEPLEKHNMGPELAKLCAPLGVYAVLGNHEGYARADRSAAFLKKWNIRVLLDEVVTLPGSEVQLAGRVDYSLPRKLLADVLARADRTRPIILMDHQPRELDKAAAAGVDLQFSGHTHGGQIWPITWIIPFLYEVSYGYARKGDFQVYVTSGLGLWGFPARIGSNSEIVDVYVEFAK